MTMKSKKSNLLFCFGCKYLQKRICSDGTILWTCKNVPDWLGEITVGEQSPNEEELPKRCSEYKKI